MAFSETEIKIEDASPQYKVVILHNVMSNWDTVDSDLCEAALQRMRQSLIERGYEVVLAPVHTDVAEPLQDLDPT